ncbi:MAG: hypothetical protein R3F54_00765 [Alphaproteobacteria bacterium]
MNSVAPTASTLRDELLAVLTGLRHARQALDREALAQTADLWPRLERCARLVARLDRAQRSAIRPVLLTVLDELQRTIAAYGAEHRELRDKLKSASRNLAADAAYRRATRS